MSTSSRTRRPRLLARLTAGLVISVGLAAVSAPGPAVAADESAPADSSATEATPGPMTTDSGYAPPPIDWGRCEDFFLTFFGMQCGYLIVPLDHADPAGPTIELAVSRLEHVSAPSKFKGAILTNPGGPGGSGLFLPIIGASVPYRAGGEWDWIGMNPRSVGTSVPRLVCDPSYSETPRPAYQPSGDGEPRKWIRRAEGYARDCAAATGSRLLDHLRTTDIVADYEALRVALGQEKVGFYGYSYGSYIGQVYATQHPERLSRIVLDANVDAGEVWYESNLAQSRAVDRNLQAFFRYLGRYPRVFGLGRGRAGVERTYLRLRDRLDRRPIDGFGAAELDDVLVVSAYSSQLWPIVGFALKPIEKRGSVRRAKRFSPRPGVQTDNAYASYLGTICTDAEFPSRLSTWARDAQANADVAPLSTWGNTWANLPCRTWPGQAEPAEQIDGSALEIPMLLAGTTLDAPTPYSGSLATRDRFPTASLVAGVGGRDHGFSLAGNRCVDTTVARYLRLGVVPERQSGRRFDKGCVVPRPTLEFFFGPTFFRAADGRDGARGRTQLERVELTRKQQIRILLDRAAIPGRS